jgi:uncharacterized protein
MAMKPFVFGDSKEPLFGIFHPSQSADQKDFGVVLCPPIAHEYVRSHRALRQLATTLASNGFPVLRFDYFGVGDSAGESGEGGSERWCADIRSAIGEMLALLNKKHFCLIGLRLGATLALRALPGQAGCKCLLLVDPIVSGSRQLDEIKEMHRRGLAGFPSMAEEEEFIGFPYPGALQRDIAGLDMLQMPAPGVEKIGILYSKNDERLEQLHAKLDGSASHCTVTAFTDAIDWTDVLSLDKTIVATNLIETILSILEEKAL